MVQRIKIEGKKMIRSTKNTGKNMLINTTIVSLMTGLDSGFIYALIKQKKMPAPMRVSARGPFIWKKGEIDAFMQTREYQRAYAKKRIYARGPKEKTAQMQLI